MFHSTRVRTKRSLVASSPSWPFLACLFDQLLKVVHHLTSRSWYLPV